MPKERIYQETFGDPDDKPLKYVEVGWTNGAGSVQVYINNYVPFRFVDDDTNEIYTGLAGHFDREGCNRLIRMIRHARNQAFGKDE